MPMRDADEYRHASPDPDPNRLFSDTLWVSVVDREANLFGINHFFLSNKGFGRFEALYIIDGVWQPYGFMVPIPKEPDKGPYTDGRLTYTVVEPQKIIRITFDGPKYGFDLTFTGRFPVYDYKDYPGDAAFPTMVGHNEQGMLCTGEFEIRAGPKKGERRRLHSWSHRDHSFSYRFADETPWELTTPSSPRWHFWPSIQLPDMHINATGWLVPGHLVPREQQEPVPKGCGFVSTNEGNDHLLDSEAEVLVEADGRTAMAFRYTLVMPDGRTLHVRTGRKYGQIKLWMRGENSLENNMIDCYEPFFDFEVEETGERGYGVTEYSIRPPWPRWLI